MGKSIEGKMFRIKVLSIGKTKEEWLCLALNEYEKRLSSRVRITWVLAKDEKDFLRQVEKENRFVCFDPHGELLTSEVFSKKVMALFAQNKNHLTFLIGGAAGLDPAIKGRSKANLSLSPMTFTHQMTRLILIEQLYRSFEICANSAYHK